VVSRYFSAVEVMSGIGSPGSSDSWANIAPADDEKDCFCAIYSAMSIGLDLYISALTINEWPGYEGSPLDKKGKLIQLVRDFTGIPGDRHGKL
jgi:hypothetical protein